jgi:GNAT superfamily N-acetyltransferase
MFHSTHVCNRPNQKAGARSLVLAVTSADHKPSKESAVRHHGMWDERARAHGAPEFQLDVSQKWPDPFRVITARLARAGDLSSLLQLFAASDVSPAIEPLPRAEAVWRETLERPGVYVFVSDEGLRIAATCMLVTAPNLLRQGRCHGFLENVVTHPDFRGRGHGRAVVGAALNQAWAGDCHHVLMQSGRADPRVHRFYERLGFLPGRRTSYVVPRPE